jgi:cell wall-associated NlpC family hydrolase
MMPRRQKNTFMQKYLIKYSVLMFLILLVASSCKTTRSSVSSTNNKKESAELTLRKGLIKEAEKHKGIKYKYAGKDPKGFDCSGFTYYVCSKYDIKLSGSSAYQSKEGIEISTSKAEPGDLLFFGRNGRSGKIQHVGMVYKNSSDGLFMIHSSSKRGIVIDNVTTSKYWKPKLLFARRVIDIK